MTRIAILLFTIAALPALAAKVTVTVVDAAGQPVANAGVYATMTSGTPPARAKRDIAIEQINKEFVPLVSIAQTGTSISFPNRDPIRHHVYSFSPAKTFEIKLYSGVSAQPVVFDKPGEVVLGCNIHDTMIAYVLLVDTPFFARTDAKGRAVLDNLPAGDFDLAMWYPGGGPAVAPQKIKLGGGDAEARFTYTGKPLSPRAPGAGTPPNYPG